MRQQAVIIFPASAKLFVEPDVALTRKWKFHSEKLLHSLRLCNQRLVLKRFLRIMHKLRIFIHSGKNFLPLILGVVIIESV